MKFLCFYLPMIVFSSFTSIFLWETAYTDCKTGKIRNRYIKKLIISVLIYLVTMTVLILAGAPYQPNSSWFINYAIHVFISGLVSVVLWKAAIWPAGDSKLFTAVSAILPLIVQDSRHFPFLLFISLLMNILLPAGAAFAIEAFRELCREIRHKGLIEYFDIGNGKLSVLLGTMFSFMLCRYASIMIREYINFPASMQFLLIFLIWPFISIFFRKFWISLILLLAACVYGYFNSSFTGLARSALASFSYSLPLILLRQLAIILMSKDSIISLSKEAIEPGLLLSDSYLKKLKKAFPDFYEENMQKMYPEGLTDTQSKELHRLFEENEEAARTLLPVEARHGKPFAEWIVAGLVLTCLLQGENVVMLFASFIKIYIRNIPL